MDKINIQWSLEHYDIFAHSIRNIINSDLSDKQKLEDISKYVNQYTQETGENNTSWYDRIQRIISMCERAYIEIKQPYLQWLNITDKQLDNQDTNN